MWWLAVALAWGQAPAEVDLTDLDRWEQGADQLLDGPDGCWELVGEADWDWDAGRLGANRGSAVFVGRMVDGVWGEVHVRSLGEVAREAGSRKEGPRLYTDEVRFVPMVGSLDGRALQVSAGETTEVSVEPGSGDAADPSNVVRGILDALSGSVDASWAQWDDARGGVVLHRAVPMGDGRNAQDAEVEVFFPGGAELPEAMDVQFPERFHRGVLPRVKIEDARMQVRGRVSGDTVFPTMETFRFTLGILGFSIQGAQTITYKSAVRCPESAPLAVPVVPDEEAEG